MSEEVKPELVICPLSEDRESVGDDGRHVSSENYFIHYASREELAKNGGVCFNCFEKIRKHHQKFQHGMTERPVEFERHIKADAHFFERTDQDNLVLTDVFNFAEVDHALGDADETPEEARAIAAELFARLLNWIWGSDGNTPIRSAMVRFTILTAGLRPELVGGRTQKEIGIELGITKSAVSKAGRDFSERFRFRLKHQRPDDAVQNMRAAMKASHERRSEAPIPPPPT